MGVPVGLLLATGVFAIFSSMPEEAFLSWGWRVPFLLGIVLLAIGMFIRLRVMESPHLKALLNGYETWIDAPLGEFLDTTTNYSSALRIVGDLFYIADDIRDFSLQLRSYEHLAEFPLSGIFLSALVNAGSVPGPLGTIYSDLKGDDFGAVDLANAMLRSSPVYPLNQWRLELPAVSFGDTGTAAGLLAVCLAIRGLRRGYLSGTRALVVASSEDGGRTALAITKVEHGQSGS